MTMDTENGAQKLSVIHLDCNAMFSESQSLVHLLDIPRGSRLQFCIEAGSTAILHNPTLCLLSNYPASKETTLDRETFYPYLPKDKYTGLMPWIVELEAEIDRAGFFEFYLQYTNEAGKKLRSSTRTFNVQPLLRIDGRIIQRDEIVLQTFLTKSLGPLDRWKGLLKEAAQTGYNMVHFTPVQELGESNSGYSLLEQMSISSSIFGKDSPIVELEERKKKVEEVLQWAEKELGILSLTDVVWNHTANNSPWLADHPEAGYSPENTPHLQVACELDEALLKLSSDIVNGVYSIQPSIDSDEDVRAVIDLFKEKVWPGLRFWEFFVIDIEEAAKQFHDAMTSRAGFTEKFGAAPLFNQDIHPIEIMLNEGLGVTGTGHRFSTFIDLDVALALYATPKLVRMDLSEVEQRCERYKHDLEGVNLRLYQQVDDDLKAILSNLFHRIRRGPFSLERPLLDSYFTRVKVNGSGSVVPLANNGWVWGADPLNDFIAPRSRAYFRRDVVPWGDTVKLRFGMGFNDNPWLWQHMKNYSEMMASMFHGLRIDNCHSTPIHVAEYMLDVARAVRPDLYIIAELFTSSEEVDSHYAAMLGISSLIRESMSAHDSWDLGRQVHRFGGRPVGSIRANKVIKGSPPHGLLMDCTHDNEVPNQKRTAADALPNSALTAMAACAIGSTRGYDQLIPRTIDLVADKRTYGPQSGGIIAAKEILNKLHQEMAQKGFTEIHIHQVENVITVQRHCPITHDAVFMIAHSKFYANSPDLTDFSRTVQIPAKIKSVILGARLRVPNQPFEADLEHFNGLHGELDLTTKDISDYCNVHMTDTDTWVVLKNFPPGSILGFRATLFLPQQESEQALQALLEDETSLPELCKDLSSVDLNVLLYRCEEEEKVTTGLCAYEIEKYGRFEYCGIASLSQLLDKIQAKNEMGHPLFDNLRQGDWLMKFTVDRLNKYPRLSSIAKWTNDAFHLAQQLPRHFIPHYFHLIIAKLHQAATQSALSRMSDFVRGPPSNDFVQRLALTSFQLYSEVGNSKLHWDRDHQGNATLAAGLPHFSTGYMRAWGRDTFISLRGLFLVTGRFDEAKELILGFAACVRHGLIPNLLDAGRNPRFNARDATWFFLQSVQDYCMMAPEGVALLKVKVQRRFPSSDPYYYTKPNPPVEHSMEDIIQEIMQQHAQGIHFREWNAGNAIDSNMTDLGFNIDITMDPETGLLFGGNKWNCGTWMDKMGEAQKAGNRGTPATPRDGAAIEIIGLLKSTLRWLSSLHTSNQFPLSGVTLHDAIPFTYQEWNNLLQDNFESHFWVPMNRGDDEAHHISSQMVHRRGIYRDTYQSSHGWTDYQLRPNMCIAMAVAPELFYKQHASEALSHVWDTLMGPLGMRTLDPQDWNYSPVYDMSLDTEVWETSKGFNYHQGPEWLWPVGYFFRAQTSFPGDCEDAQRVHRMMDHFLRFKRHMEESPWQGLTELTNANGAQCTYSSPTQAWSMATTLDALYDTFVKKDNI